VLARVEVDDDSGAVPYHDIGRIQVVVHQDQEVQVRDAVPDTMQQSTPLWLDQGRLVFIFAFGGSPDALFECYRQLYGSEEVSAMSSDCVY
jgi:hypothetical protein